MTDRFQVLFSGVNVQLHDLDGTDRASAKTRRIVLPRNGALGETDPNVLTLRAMANAGNMAWRALAA